MKEEQGAPGIDDAAAATAPWGGRLLRLRNLETSVELAKVALGQAEVSMRSVQAGLALEPMLPAAAVDVPLVAPPDPVPRIFDPTTHYRNLLLSQVPLALQALALVLVGWCAAFALREAVGPDRVDDVAAAVRRPIAALFTRAANDPAMELPGASMEPRLVSGEPPVIIYERTSPYPTQFSKLSDKERYCLAEAIYYEARGEPAAGQIAVAQVVLNRTHAGSWPRNVCEVTHQGVENGEKCQFSYACMRRLLTKPFGDAWDNAQGLAEEILAGGAWLEEMLDATHFHRWDLKPVWRLTLVEVGRFGRHVFYNSPTENRRPLSKHATR